MTMTGAAGKLAPVFLRHGYAFCICFAEVKVYLLTNMAAEFFTLLVEVVTLLGGVAERIHSRRPLRES